MDSHTKNSTISSSPQLTKSPVLARKRKRKSLMSTSPVLKSTRRPPAPFVQMVPSDQSPSSPIIETCYSPSQHRSDSPVLPTKRFKPRSLFVITENNSSDSDTELYHIESSVHFSRCHKVDIEVSLNPNVTESQNVNIQVPSDEMSSPEDPEISQISTQSLSTSFSTPTRNQVRGVFELNKKIESSSESTRKKKHYIPNGLAHRLRRLTTRQESDYRLWRHQTKCGKELAEDENILTLLVIRSENRKQSHICVDCRLLNGPLVTKDSKVTLLLNKDRWDSFQISSKQVLCIHSPWKSLETRFGTVILGINLMRRLDPTQLDFIDSNAADLPLKKLSEDEVVTLQSFTCPCLTEGSCSDPTSCDAQVDLWGLRQLL